MFSTVIGLITAILMIGPPGYGHGGGRDEPRSRLTLSYLAEAGFATAVKLDCDPAGGGHPKPEEACAELTAVGGDPSRIQPEHYACILIYLPVTAEIKGDWRGKPVEWRHTYGNTCEMRRALGVLFVF